ITPELSCLGLARVERGWLREHRTEATGLAPRPPQQQQSEREEQRRFDVQQKTDGINAAVNDPHVDAPEKEETEKLPAVDAKPVRGRGRVQIKNRDADFVTGIAANPGLVAEPAATHQRPDGR